MSAAPPHLGDYWATVDAELARFPARPTWEPSPIRSDEHFTVYEVRATSIGPYRIFGYLSVPTGPGPFPGLLETPAYGSVNYPADYNDRLRYVVLTVMHRGQRLADQPFAAPYPGLLTTGIEDPQTYVYRGIVADCLRAADLLRDRPEVDPDRVAVKGDDLALITASRRDMFCAVQLTGQLFYRAMEARHHTTAYPLEELNDYLRAYPGAKAAVGDTLALFDPRHHAPAVRAATRLPVGDDGGLTARGWLAPLADALGGPVDCYQVTHEGRTDLDAADTWLAERLGAPPMSRFRR